MYRFKRGDKVVIKEMVGCAYKKLKGKKGIVVNLKQNSDASYYVGIDFGIGFVGHNLDEEINTHTGWYVDSKKVKLIDKKIGNISSY